jgi:hypothetical protein
VKDMFVQQIIYSNRGVDIGQEFFKNFGNFKICQPLDFFKKKKLSKRIKNSQQFLFLMNLQYLFFKQILKNLPHFGRKAGEGHSNNGTSIYIY